MIVKHGKVTVTENETFIENFTFKDVSNIEAVVEAIEWAREILLKRYFKEVNRLPHP